jgi:twitching motility protein PilU
MMVAQDSSDLFLSVGAPPAMKSDGETQILDAPVLDSQTLAGLADSLLDEARKKTFEVAHEMNLTLDRAGIGRFRVNLYRQRGETAMAIRYIPSRIPDIESLNLPPNVRDLIMLKRGLVLVVGAAGSGKSTTLAAMIDYRNRHRSGHILTIEDPIEFVHTHNKSIVDQREVGIDTNSYADALKNAMREAPDVIMIGEIRDRETMEQALRRCIRTTPARPWTASSRSFQRARADKCCRIFRRTSRPCFPCVWCAAQPVAGACRRRN